LGVALSLVGAGATRSLVAGTGSVPKALARCRIALVSVWLHRPAIAKLFDMISFGAGLAFGALVVLLLATPSTPTATTRAPGPQQAPAATVVVQEAAYTDAPLRPAAERAAAITGRSQPVQPALVTPAQQQ